MTTLARSIDSTSVLTVSMDAHAIIPPGEQDGAPSLANLNGRHVEVTMGPELLHLLIATTGNILPIGILDIVHDYSDDSLNGVVTQSKTNPALMTAAVQMRCLEALQSVPSFATPDVIATICRALGAIEKVNRNLLVVIREQLFGENKKSGLCSSRELITIADAFDILGDGETRDTILDIIFQRDSAIHQTILSAETIDALFVIWDTSHTHFTHNNYDALLWQLSLQAISERFKGKIQDIVNDLLIDDSEILIDFTDHNLVRTIVALAKLGVKNGKLFEALENQLVRVLGDMPSSFFAQDLVNIAHGFALAGFGSKALFQIIENRFLANGSAKLRVCTKTQLSSLLEAYTKRGFLKASFRDAINNEIHRL